MRIHHCPKLGHFTMIPNLALRDDRLSYGARGLLGALLSFPDGWQTNADTLARIARRARPKTGEGRRTMRAYMTELEAAGYIRRERIRGARGRIQTVLHITDDPTSAIADVPASGTPVPPAETDESPGGTEVPPTGASVSGTSIRTLTDEDWFNTVGFNTAPFGRGPSLPQTSSDGRDNETGYIRDAYADLAEQLIQRLGADYIEAAMIEKMVDRGDHPRFIENTVRQQRGQGR